MWQLLSSMWDTRILTSSCWKLTFFFVVYPVQANSKLGHHKSLLHLSSCAVFENPRGQAMMPAVPYKGELDCCQVSPAGPPTVQMTLDKAESSADDDVDDDDDDDDDQDSTASSSLPSPEIFRTENCGVCADFSLYLHQVFYLFLFKIFTSLVSQWRTSCWVSIFT